MLNITKLWLVFLVYFLTLFSNIGQAQDNHIINSNNFNKNINLYSSLNLSRNNDLFISDVIALPRQKWQKLSANDNGISLLQGKNWITFELKNTSKDSFSAYFSIINRLTINNIQLFSIESPKIAKNIPLQLSRNKLLLGQLIINKQENNKFYLFIDSSESMNIPISITSNNSFYQRNNNKQYLQGFALGGMVFLSIVLFSLYIATSSKSAFLLSGYFISRTLFLSVLLGGGLHYYLPEYTDIKGFELPLLNAGSSICLLWFSVYLFDLKNTALNSYNLIRLLCLALLAYMPFSLLLNINTNILICLSIHSFTLLVLVFIGCVLIKKSTRLSRLFTFVMLILFLLSLLNHIEVNNNNLSSFDFNTFICGASFWLDSFLIIFLFCREYYYQLKEQQKIQKQLLASTLASKNAQEELLTLQQETQEQLEIRVQEHTLELHVTLQELEEANRELTEKNTLDELTGLYNRRFYDQKILAEYRRSRRNLTPLSLIIIDIDFFKKVNDNYGHLAGDYCLTLVAKQLKLQLHRTADTACRYGGEEFCIILPETAPQGAVALAESLRNVIETLTVVYENQTIPLTISCGVSSYLQQSGILPEHLFAAADKALYLAKQQGRNQTQEIALQNESQDKQLDEQ